MNNIRKTLYTVAKWVCLVGLPGVVVLVATLGSIWGWTGTQQICATLSAIDTCLGTFIGIFIGKDEKTVDGGLVVDEDGKVVDVVADEADKNITQGKEIVKLAVMKDTDPNYTGKK